MKIAVLSQGLLSRIVALFQNCPDTRQYKILVLMENGFHLQHLYPSSSWHLFGVKLCYGIHLALPGQCVTEAILFKNVFTKTNLNLQFGKKWPYGGRAPRTIWKIICAIKANTDKPNKAFWKWLVEATAVKMNNKQNNINNTCIMENDNRHQAQVAKICPLM